MAENTTSSAAARKQTALAFIQAFHTMSASDHTRLRTPNCIHHYAPASLGLPAESNSEFEAHITQALEMISSFPFTVKEMVDNPPANQVLVWTLASPIWHSKIVGTDTDDEWKYTGEYMFLFTFEEGQTGVDVNGEKIKRLEGIVEFLDSQATMEMFGLIGKAKTRLEAQADVKKDGVECCSLKGVQVTNSQM